MEVPREKVVVCDNGTGYVKCGFAGDNFPRAVFPCMVGRPTMRYEEQSSETTLRDIMVGDEAAEQRNNLEVRTEWARHAARRMRCSTTEKRSHALSLVSHKTIRPSASLFLSHTRARAHISTLFLRLCVHGSRPCFLSPSGSHHTLIISKNQKTKKKE